MTDTPPGSQSEAAQALDQLGELIDQLAGNAREFDYNAANRMERDAAKALLAIEAAVNALPELRERVKRLEEALEPFALVAEHDIGSDETDRDIFRPMLVHNHAPRLSVGDLRRARAALKETGATEVFQELAKKQEPLGAEFEAAIGDPSTLYET